MSREAVQCEAELLLPYKKKKKSFEVHTGITHLFQRKRMHSQLLKAMSSLRAF